MFTGGAGCTELEVVADGSCRTLILQRPKKLNALTLHMVQGIFEAATLFQQDSGVDLMIVKGGGERAFCAGGDVRANREIGLRQSAWHDGKTGWADAAMDDRGPDAGRFIREEYTMNNLLANAPAQVPQVSLWRGIVMGGGAGISVHGRFRVATDTTLFAMPECAIGTFKKHVYSRKIQPVLLLDCIAAYFSPMSISF
jgi:enoyl-CoA hydratase/carnithine racemase